jgi:hypothetical protein
MDYDFRTTFTLSFRGFFVNTLYCLVKKRSVLCLLSSYFAPFLSPFQISVQIHNFSRSLSFFYVAGRVGEVCICKLKKEGGGGFGAKYDVILFTLCKLLRKL